MKNFAGKPQRQGPQVPLSVHHELRRSSLQFYLDVNIGTVKSEIEQDKIGRTTAEEEPAVTEFLQKIWAQYVFQGLSRRKRQIRYPERLLMGNVVVQRIKQFQPFQVRHIVKMHDGSAVVLRNGQLVLETAYDIAHF